MTGQINLGSSAGDLIKRLSQRQDVQQIVEIGTWNGLGSTVCVLSGIKNTHKQFLSIELYPEMYEVAKRNLSEHLPRFSLICGTIVTIEDLNWFNHQTVRDAIDKEHSAEGIHVAHAKEWFMKDIEAIKHATNVLNIIPANIDLLILDGGEYSTYPEWKKLKDRTKIIFIDDTTLMKGAKIRAEIIDSNLYQVIKDDQADRYGYSVFERKPQNQ